MMNQPLPCSSKKPWRTGTLRPTPSPYDHSPRQTPNPLGPLASVKSRPLPTTNADGFAPPTPWRSPLRSARHSTSGRGCHSTGPNPTPKRVDIGLTSDDRTCGVGGGALESGATNRRWLGLHRPMPRSSMTLAVFWPSPKTGCTSSAPRQPYWLGRLAACTRLGGPSGNNPSVEEGDDQSRKQCSQEGMDPRFHWGGMSRNLERVGSLDVPQSRSGSVASR